MLVERIKKREAGIVLYGLTPPKQQNSPEKLAGISQKHIQRINSLDIDGLVLYDIQDETLRTSDTRPFPFLPTIDPLVYSSQYLSELPIPKIIYQCIGKHTRSSFTEWLQMTNMPDFLSVFVGAASRKQEMDLSMGNAYDLRKQVNSNMCVGAIAIPERHVLKGNEHERMFDKISQGCSYFISQAVYNLEASKNLLSDYYYEGMAKERATVPVIITLSPCGSEKTLQFMKWLGISILKWLENDLKHSQDILAKSVDHCLNTFEELFDFCREKGIPLGCNIESVAIRKEEIDASVDLLRKINKIINRRQAKD